MMKKVIAILCCSFAYQLVFADTCPSVKDIKSKPLNDWKVYDSDDGKPLTQAEAAQYKKSIEEFVLAEWASEKNQNGTMHCYYRDTSGSSLEAYLAKDHFVLNNQKNYWYKVSGFMHCAAGMEKCTFDNPLITNHKQLAKK